MEKEKRKPFLIVMIFISVGLIALMIITSANMGETGVVEGVVGRALMPIQGFFTGIADGISDGFQSISEYRTIKDEYYLLLDELKQYENTSVELEEMKNENERLLSITNFVEEHEQYAVLGARIIGKDSDYWYSTLIIDRGTSEGVRLDMAAMTPDGLVGRVVETAEHWSKVQIILDSRSAVSTIIQRTRDEGILKGSNSAIEKSEECRMIYLPKDSDIEVGDRVITSGLGDIFPKGLLVGNIKEIYKNNYEPYYTAIVEPSADFKNIEELMLVSDSQ